MNRPVTPHMKRLARLLVLACLTGASSCGDKEDNNAGTGAGATTAGGAGGMSGASGGSGATGGTSMSGGTGGDAQVGGTTGGMSMTGGSGGMTGGSGGMTGGSGGTDAGEDSGMQSGSSCREITPAADPGNECPDTDPVALKLTMLRTDLMTPIFVTHAPDDDERLFLVQRGGIVLVLNRETGATEGTFLDITDRVVAPDEGNSGGEYGLLGLAFHPDYPDDPRIFVNYTTDPEAGDLTSFQQSITSSFEVSGDDPNDIDEDTEQVLLHWADPQSNHNGGMLAFGADDCLYLASGDGGNSNDSGAGHVAGGNGQSLDTPLGKILRFDVDDVASAAPGNLEGAGYPHIWSYGMRNPWRFSFDRETGDMYIGDVGQDVLEEVDVEPAGVGGRNYGWPIAEGHECRGGGGTCGTNAGLTDAVDDYAHVMNVDNCVVGGYVYRGDAIPSLRTWYLYADHGGGRKIRTLVWNGTEACDEPIDLAVRDGLQPPSAITSFGEDASGELYITTGTGGLYRIDAE